MNTAAIQTNSVATPLFPVAGNAAQQGEGGGFMQLIDQLLAGLNMGEIGLPGKQEELSEEDMQLMMQQMAAMMSAGMPTQLIENTVLVPDNLGENTFAALTVQTGTEQSGENTATLLELMQSAAQKVQTLQTEQTEQSPQSTFAQLTQLEQMAGGKGESIITQTSFTAAQSTQDDGAVVGFEQVVRSVKSELQDSADQSKSDGKQGETDIDKLQKLVDEGKYLGGMNFTQGMNRTNFAQKLEQSQFTSPAQQTFDGIKQGIAEGRQEFVIRLKPEGLGEITVKLAQGDAGLTLNIVAANQNTAKLLSTEMATLRANLVEQGTQVQTIIVQSPQETSSYLAQDQSGRQNFFGSSGQGQKQPEQNRRSTVNMQNNITMTAAEDLDQLQQNSALDTYI